MCKKTSLAFVKITRRIHLRFFFSSRRRHTRSLCDWSSDVCSSDLEPLTVEFMIGDPETAADQLQLSADSSDPILIPSTNIVFSGSGANRSATIRTGAPVDQGQITITLTRSEERRVGKEGSTRGAHW